MTIRRKSNAIQQLEGIRKGPSAFKDLLHSIRTTGELSQVELADLTRTSKAKICDFEKGRRTPSLGLVLSLLVPLATLKLYLYLS